MAIKLSKKKVAAYNKSQTTPKTPSKVVPFIDRMRVSINFEPGGKAEEIHGNIWTQVADKEVFTQIASKGSYSAAWRIKIASALKLKHYPLMQYRHDDKCAVRLAIDCAPNDLGPEGLDLMHISLKSIVDGGWVAFVGLGKVNMIEVTVDLHGVPMGDFHVLPQQTTTVKSWSNAGKLETLYLGKTQGNFTRIYDRGKKRTSKKQAWTHGHVTRVERVLKGQAIPVASLGSLDNVFAGIKMVDLPPSAPPEGKGYIWTLFCDAVAQRGLPAALKVLPADTYRKNYRKWLAQHPKLWWQPEEIWAEWGPMIEKTRLASEDWF
ncbi:hypothetical protein ACK8OR_07355 [Jannaschia sp. KMU-145]|uniref:hypothetical protein n=1 Tax=Jannaschia halovivens TaxID=3388667 RepID=UPI00396AF444